MNNESTDTPRTNVCSVYARDLRDGMVCIGSGHTINAVFTSVRCPQGKIHVDYTRIDGVRRVDTWNRSTIVQVFIPDAETGS